MKSLLLSSIILLLFSCKSANIPSSKEDSDGVGFRSYFDSTNTSIHYKADVTIYGHYFSGILFLKFSNDTICRAAMVTITGATLFDLEITPKTDTVYSCMPQMNKPMVLKGIEKNIRTVTMLDNFQKETKIIKGEDFDGIIWEKYAAEEIWHFYQPKGELINKVEVFDKKYKKKMKLTVENFVKNFPIEIDIKNLNFKLQIHLTQL